MSTAQSMPKTPAPRSRSLVTFTRSEVDQLIAEAKKKGLKLATYIRSLVLTHQERTNGTR